MSDDTAEITALLERAKTDAEAMNELFQSVQSQFRAIAWREINNEAGYHTLQATCLLDDAFLKLMQASDVEWESRDQFFGAACRVMRQLLIDHYRRRRTDRRGGFKEEGRRRPPTRISLDELLEFQVDDRLEDPDAIVALHELVQRLKSEHPTAFQVLELRFYMQCDVKQVAELLDISPATVKRRWQMARSYLYKEWTGREMGDV